MRDPKPLVIVAEKVEGTALQMLVHNHVNGHLQGHRDPGAGLRREARAPAGGHGGAVRRQGALEGVVVRVRADGAEHLGRASQVRATNEQTAIIGGGGAADARRAAAVPAARGDGRATIGTDEDWLGERIARLSGKAAII